MGTRHMRKQWTPGTLPPLLPSPWCHAGTRLGACMHPHGELYKSTITVRSGAYLKSEPVPLHFALPTPSPSDMPAWYPLWLDPWQLSLKYLNSATELLSDSVAQLVRAWQAICQVVGSSPSLSHCHFLFFLFITFILTDFDSG